MRKPLKLWEKTARTLARMVAAGHWPVGTIIPPEVELAKTHKVSRDTMRKAIGSLVKSGLFERTPHVGTRVVSHSQSVGFLNEFSSLRDIDRFGNQFPRRIENTAVVKISEAVSEKTGIPAGQMRLCCSNVRFDPRNGDEAVVVTRVYMSPFDTDVAEAARRKPRELLADLIADKHKLKCVEVRQVLLATAMPKDVAAKFQLPAGSPSLLVVRIYIDEQGDAFTCSMSYHPADSYVYSFSSRRG